MTREEAIKTLKENCCAMCAYASHDMDSCDIRGCDNRDAIKVLEQEPCTDAISRQAAIDACLNGWNKDYKEIVKDIRTLPSVTPQPCEVKTDNKCQECEKDWTKCTTCPVMMKWVKEHEVTSDES